MGHGRSKEYMEKRPYLNTQEDWNCTLITRFNLIGLDILKKSGSKGPFSVSVPKKFSEMIESLPYFKNQSLGEKYIINYTDTNIDKIEFEGYTITVLNFENLPL